MHQVVSRLRILAHLFPLTITQTAKPLLHLLFGSQVEFPYLNDWAWLWLLCRQTQALHRVPLPCTCGTCDCLPVQWILERRGTESDLSQISFLLCALLFSIQKMLSFSKTEALKREGVCCMCVFVCECAQLCM